MILLVYDVACDHTPRHKQTTSTVLKTTKKNMLLYNNNMLQNYTSKTPYNSNDEF